MTVVCDFTVVQDGTPAPILAREVWTRSFDTRARVGDSQALLIFNVRDLSGTALHPLVNGREIGDLRSYEGTSDRNWYSQTLVFDSNFLHSDEPNILSIQATVESGDFRLKDIVCFFKQDV